MLLKGLRQSFTIIKKRGGKIDCFILNGVEMQNPNISST
jgi:hypothetical protein